MFATLATQRPRNSRGRLGPATVAGTTGELTAAGATFATAGACAALPLDRVALPDGSGCEHPAARAATPANTAHAGLNHPRTIRSPPSHFTLESRPPSAA